jgi:hypothetical protein
MRWMRLCIQIKDLKCMDISRLYRKRGKEEERRRKEEEEELPPQISRS